MKLFILVFVSVVMGATPLPTKPKPPLSVQPKTTQVSVTQKNVQEAPTPAPAPDPAPVVQEAAPVEETPVEETPAPSQPDPTPAPTGDCATWMADAGITDTANATLLLNWESHCNPNAVNQSSGACGLAQELPCGKSGCSLGDGSCQMKWFNQYVIGRYGSMAAAVAFHEAHGWY